MYGQKIQVYDPENDKDVMIPSCWLCPYNGNILVSRESCVYAYPEEYCEQYLECPDANLCISYYERNVKPIRDVTRNNAERYELLKGY